MTNARYLLKEFASFEFDEKDTETDDKGMTLKGILQRCDTLNQNGRIYPRNVLVRELENYSKLIREKRAFGELDHASEAVVNMKTVSHMITEIWMDGDVVWGKVRLLDTPCGDIVKAVIKAGGRPGISSRAVGSLMKEHRRDGEVNVVQDDLQIVCWDFVSEPSTPGAFMALAEAKIINPVEAQRALTKSDRVFRALNSLLVTGK